MKKNQPFDLSKTWGDNDGICSYIGIKRIIIIIINFMIIIGIILIMIILVLAEFDIDTGSTVRHQYPKPIREECNDHYKEDWLAEHMLPEGAHNRDVDYTYIFLNRNGKLIDDLATTTTESKDLFYYGINLVRTKHDTSVRRGALVKAMAIFSRYSFIEIFKKPLELALRKYFDNQSADILASLYRDLNATDLSNIPKPNSIEKMLMRRGVGISHLGENITYRPKSWNQDLLIPVDVDSVDGPPGHISLSIKLYYTPDEVGDISVTNLVQTFGPAVMRIYHGIITGQRILFVGYNHAASDVAQMVLSAVALVSPPIPSVIRRAYAYANLTDMSFLEVPGYISGVTNPMFQQHESWWDLLCVLDLPHNTGSILSAEEKRHEDSSGRTDRSSMSVNSNKQAQINNDGSNENEEEEGNSYINMDEKFIAGVLSGIQSKLGEEWVRQQFIEYTNSILYLAQNISLLKSRRLNEKKRKALEANSFRANILRKTSEFSQAPSNPWMLIDKNKIQDKDLDEENIIDSEKGDTLKYYIFRLQNEENIHPKYEAEKMYFELSRLKSEADIQALLTLLPESEGGLYPITVGLFNPNPSVRLYTLQLLESIRKFPSTCPSLDGLNFMLLSAFKNVENQMISGNLDNEIKAYNIRTKDRSNSQVLMNNNDKNNNSDSNNISAGFISVDEIDLIP